MIYTVHKYLLLPHKHNYYNRMVILLLTAQVSQVVCLSLPDSLGAFLCTPSITTVLRQYSPCGRFIVFRCKPLLTNGYYGDLPSVHHRKSQGSVILSTNFTIRFLSNRTFLLLLDRKQYWHFNI